MAGIQAELARHSGDVCGPDAGGVAHPAILTAEERIVICQELFFEAFPGEIETWQKIVEAVLGKRAFIELSADRKSFAIAQPVHDIHIWTVGGDMAGVLEIEASISRRAAESGFDRMTVLPSRENWDRVLRARGWKSEATVPLVKEL